MYLGGILLKADGQGFVPLTLEQSLKLSVHRSCFHFEKPNRFDLNTPLFVFCTTKVLLLPQLSQCSGFQLPSGAPGGCRFTVTSLPLYVAASAPPASAQSCQDPSPRQGFLHRGCQASKRRDLVSICQHLNNFIYTYFSSKPSGILVSLNHASQRRPPACSLLRSRTHPLECSRSATTLASL